MEQSSEDVEQSPSGCMWGCLGISLTGVAVYAFGFLIVGRVTVFAIFVGALAAALRTGRFEWAFTHRTLERRTRPLAFCCIAALFAVLACLPLWLFIQDLRGLPR